MSLAPTSIWPVFAMGRVDGLRIFRWVAVPVNTSVELLFDDRRRSRWRMTVRDARPMWGPA